MLLVIDAPRDDGMRQISFHQGEDIEDLETFATAVTGQETNVDEWLLSFGFGRARPWCPVGKRPGARMAFIRLIEGGALS